MRKIHIPKMVVEPFVPELPENKAFASNDLKSHVDHAHEQQELSTAGAFSNDSPDKCPKCCEKMNVAYLSNKYPVYYCDRCGVAHPYVTLG